MQALSEQIAARMVITAIMVMLAISVSTPVMAQPRSGDELAKAYFDSGASPDSGVGVRLGYISLGEDEPFVSVVTEGIREQAALAGAELVVCDSRFDPDEALVCARQMASLGVEGILNFQPSEEDAGRICTAHGNLPTIAIDIRQTPCERVFVGADNPNAGRLTGVAVGEHMRAETDCAYDNVLVIEASAVGHVGAERVAGMVEGFEEICGPIPEADLVVADVQGDSETAVEWLSALLPTLEVGGTHVVLSINNGAAEGAADAAAALGREAELRIGAQGAESLRSRLACGVGWVAATAYFPERYGHILVPAMLDLLAGEDMPAELLMPHAAVTKDNIRDLLDDVPECEG